MPRALDESDQRFLDIIDEHGWHVMHVSGDADGPPFTYSTGIFALTGRPEMIVFGLPMEVGHFVVNEYGGRMRDGESIEAGDFLDGFLEGHPVTFVAVADPGLVKRYATWTDWFYERRPFPLLQLVYPDSRSGAFPWQAGYRKDWRAHQPLLGAPPSRN